MSANQKTPLQLTPFASEAVNTLLRTICDHNRADWKVVARAAELLSLIARAKQLTYDAKVRPKEPVPDTFDQCRAADRAIHLAILHAWKEDADAPKFEALLKVIDEGISQLRAVLPPGDGDPQR